MPIDWNRSEQHRFDRALITAKRIEAEMSKRDLAKAVEVAPTTISNIEGDTKNERGELHGCKTKTLLRIVDVLDIPRRSLELPDDPTPDPSGLSLGVPRTINFRPNRYPAKEDDEYILDAPLMMLVCPTSFRVTGESDLIVEKVMASLSVGQREYFFQLRTWADLVKAGPTLKEALELLDLDNRPIRNRSNEIAARAKADAAWAAQAPAEWSGTINFEAFPVKSAAPPRVMQACFRAVDEGLAWGDFLDLIDPAEGETPLESVRITIMARVRSSSAQPTHSTQKITVEGRCLHRIKRWVEDRRPNGHLVRHLQPRVVEGEEDYCGREGYCCFDPGDKCRPARA